MQAVKLRNKPAEAEFVRYLKLWRGAMRNLGSYDERGLMFIWRQLESAWHRIGYVIGDGELGV